MEIKGDTSAFRVSSFMKIRGDESTLAARDELMLFLNEVLEIFPAGGKEEIHFLLSDNYGKAEGYGIKAENSRITVTANSAAGLFFAVQTLKQLFFQCGEYLSELEIYDEPLYSVRPLMLDCGSYFFTKEEIFRFLELMALHKLNELHWCLSDDQGFRCQLDCAPLLTEIGSVRSHTGMKNEEHSGYYTKADIKEIIAFAHSKHIRVVPEINAPGHTVSMISAYPELSCRGVEIPVATTFGAKKDILCIGKESTFDFMLSLYNELSTVFTDGIIHLGGDVPSRERWRECPHCRSRIKNESLADENDLDSYYISRIAGQLHKKGVEVRIRTLSRWNSYVIKDSSELHALNEADFIASNTPCCQLDLPYEEINLERAYKITAVNPSDNDADRMIGMEACLRTERIPNVKKADFALLPRLAAFCENAWSSPENRNYDRFSANLKEYYRLLYALGYTPATLKRALPGSFRRIIRRLFPSFR